MPLWWPFGKRRRRTSTSTSTSATTATATTRTTTTPMTTPTAYATTFSTAEKEKEKEKEEGGGESESRPVEAQVAAAPRVSEQQGQAQAAVCPSSRSDSPSRRHKAASASNDTPGNDSSDYTLSPDRDRRGSVQHDITALPSMPELETSPHLRPANVTKPVHPYTLGRPSSSRKPDISGPGTNLITPAAAPLKSKPNINSGPHPTSSLLYSPPTKRPKNHVLREEEIRQMSAPVPIPKRPAGSASDLLRRESKKARKTLTKRNDDPRSSNVSIPFPDSIHSSMSAVSERAWEVSGISILSPRPTVRLSGTGFNAQYAKRQPHKEKPKEKERLPEISRNSSRKDRRKVAEIADDLDSSELRLLMERDTRRKERKATEQHERLDRKLRKRAEKQRAEEERRIREARQRAGPPTAVHPAFREQSPARKDGKKPELDYEEDRGRSVKSGTYLRYPARQDIPQNPFADPGPEPSNPFTTPPAEYYSPIQTPMEDPILETAKAIRLSTGHVSPPSSPVPDSSALARIPSEMESRRTISNSPGPAVIKNRRPSESSARRTSTWASIFRRGPSASRTSEDKLERPSHGDFSFVNASRESMSKQPIPVHLVQQPPTCQSGAPVRTQSKFREDLPELPISPPASRVQSPDLSVAAAHVAAARRAAKRAARNAGYSSGTEPMDIPARGRTDSPTVFEDQPSTVLSQSFASIDSEGSWMSGRPLVKRTSNPSQPRSSLGSFAKPKEDFNASYDRLPVPDHEYFSTLTPEPGSRRASGEQTVDITPIAEINDDVPMRQRTARHKPTVVHNDPRYKSREGLLTEFEAGEMVSPQRGSSSSGESADNSPIELKKAESVNYGRGHMKSLSAGSAKLMDIPQSRSRSLKTSPNSSPHIS